jgi:large subunit ribosomal protein L29
MNAAEMKALDVSDLKSKVKAMEEEVFRVRFQHATAQLQDASKLKKTRRDLARAKTVLRLKELGK